MIQLPLRTRVQGPRIQILLSLSHLQLNRQSYRFFTHASTSRYSKISPESKPLVQQPSPTGSPETLLSRGVPDVTNSKSSGVPQAPDLLAEQTVSNKQQRKADWAIMKEMSRYLWPSVRKARVR